MQGSVHKVHMHKTVIFDPLPPLQSARRTLWPTPPHTLQSCIGTFWSTLVSAQKGEIGISCIVRFSWFAIDDLVMHYCHLLPCHVVCGQFVVRDWTQAVDIGLQPRRDSR